jgi:hypothetical protein
LTFEGAGTAGDGSTILDSYGDNVTGDGVPLPAYGYDEGNGWTPNIAVDHEVRAADDSVIIVADLAYYGAGYATPDVAYQVGNELIGELTFTPDAGYSVRINSFRISVWNDGATYTDTVLRLKNAARDAVLWSTGPESLNSSTGPATVVIPVNYTGNPGQPLRLQFGLDWNIGIDDINFDQVIPEPASALLLMGVTPLLVRRRPA